MRLRILLMLLSALAPACTDREEAVPAEQPANVPPEPDEEPDPPPTGPAPSPAQALMHGHFEQASDARAALIRGDIESAREAMRWLGEHPLQQTLPEPLRVMLPPMQAAARRFAEAKTLRDAGRALGHTLVRCGECHQSSGKGPSFPLPEIPRGDDPPNHMQRHLWAAERMLEGLVTGSTERFMAGASALNELPVALEKIAPPAELVGEVEALQKHVHELQPKAVAARDAAAQADVYGDLLASCAACHRMLARGPI